MARDMKFSDIQKMNADYLERKRIDRVINRALLFNEQYQAAKDIFTDIDLTSKHVRHEEGLTIISGYISHVYSLSKNKSFIEREKGIFYHRSAPVRIALGTHYSRVIIDWGLAE